MSRGRCRVAVVAVEQTNAGMMVCVPLFESCYDYGSVDKSTDEVSNAFFARELHGIYLFVSRQSLCIHHPHVAYLFER